MTQPPAAVPSPPLSITCTAELRFAETIVALASRMAAGTGETPASRRFTEAVTAVTRACFDQLSDGDERRSVTTDLSEGASAWQAALRWQRRAADDDALHGVLQASLSSLVDHIECGHGGTESFCRLSCSRA